MNKERTADNEGNSQNKDKWRPNTTLIVGDSIINGLIENKLSTTKYPVKVRAFPGAKICDMHHYLVPLFKKEPTNVIFHCETNDALYKSPEEIIGELMKLELFIEVKLPNSSVIVSFPTLL